MSASQNEDLAVVEEEIELVVSDIIPENVDPGNQEAGQLVGDAGKANGGGVAKRNETRATRSAVAAKTKLGGDAGKSGSDTEVPSVVNKSAMTALKKRGYSTNGDVDEDGEEDSGVEEPIQKKRVGASRAKKVTKTNSGGDNAKNDSINEDEEDGEVEEPVQKKRVGASRAKKATKTNSGDDDVDNDSAEEVDSAGVIRKLRSAHTSVKTTASVSAKKTRATQTSAGKNKAKAATADKKTKKQSGAGQEYIVEKIVGSKTSKGQTLYNVKWQKYATSQNTWEPEANLTNCDEILAAFKESQTEKSDPKKPTKAVKTYSKKATGKKSK